MKDIIVNGKKITPSPFTVTINNRQHTIINQGINVSIDGESYRRNIGSVCYTKDARIEIEKFKVFIDHKEIKLDNENINLIGNGFVNHVSIDGKDFVVIEQSDRYIVNDETLFKGHYSSCYESFGHISCENGRLLINDEPISFNGKFSDFDIDEEDDYKEEICDE